MITTELPVFSTRLVSYMDLEEALVEKVRAIQFRQKGRDVYDLWYLINRGVKFDWELVQKKMDMAVRRFLPLKDRPVLNKIKELILEKIRGFKMPNGRLLYNRGCGYC